MLPNTPNRNGAYKVLKKYKLFETHSHIIFCCALHEPSHAYNLSHNIKLLLINSQLRSINTDQRIESYLRGPAKMMRTGPQPVFMS